MLAVFSKHVVCCLDSIRDKKQKAILTSAFCFGGRSIINLSFAEMTSMCGNMIQVMNKDNEECIILSAAAKKGLTPEHRAELMKHYKLVSSDIKTIEKIGGGSARCMVAEIY